MSHFGFVFNTCKFFVGCAKSMLTLPLISPECQGVSDWVRVTVRDSEGDGRNVLKSLGSGFCLLSERFRGRK